MTSWLGPLGPGFFGTVDENSRRYFRFFSARWRLKSVEGFRTIAERISRPGRMRSAQTPATMRSAKRRFGERFRDRLRMSSCCLTSTDSATTERAPPGPASRATVANRCRKRTARSRTAHPSKIATPQKCNEFTNSPCTWSLAERAESFRFLTRDQDQKFTDGFDNVFRGSGIEILRTPFRAPQANGVAERFVRTVRSECLDRLLILNDQHLERVLDV